MGLEGTGAGRISSCRKQGGSQGLCGCQEASSPSRSKAVCSGVMAQRATGRFSSREETVHFSKHSYPATTGQHHTIALAP